MTSIADQSEHRKQLLLIVAGTIIGFLWAEGVIVEIILFAFSARIVRRLGVGGLLLVAV